MSQQQTRETDVVKRIEASVDKDAMAITEVSDNAGGLAFKDMGQVMEFSKLMAVSQQAVPNHLRGKPGACLAVAVQALNWRMEPFAVANKSYMVNDRIAYEAQLIQAVIEQRAPIKGRIKGSFSGEGAVRRCHMKCVSAEDGETIEYTSPNIGSITIKNSPLWKSDPDQQLWYYSARAMCRRHFPDVLLGVYEKDEIDHAPKMRDVTPNEGFAAMAKNAKRSEKDEPEQTAQTIEADALPSELEDQQSAPAEDAIKIEPSELSFAEGLTAGKDPDFDNPCPYGDDKAYEKAHWQAGFKHGQKMAREL